MKTWSLKFILISMGWALFSVIYCNSELLFETDEPWAQSSPPRELVQASPTLDPKTAGELESLLAQHHKLTGERALLVLIPWRDQKQRFKAQKTAKILSERWRLDTTSRGATILLVLQEDTLGTVKMAYQPGIGLSKSQVATDQELDALIIETRRFQETKDWNELGRSSLTWILQTLESPLLENPELWNFQPTELPKSMGTARRSTFWGNILFFIALASGAILLLEAVRRGVRPRFLIGPQRVVRFTLTDEIQNWIKSRFSKKQSHHLSCTIESLEGRP